jgi:hypothetical protein
MTIVPSPVTDRTAMRITLRVMPSSVAWFRDVVRHRVSPADGVNGSLIGASRILRRQSSAVAVGLSASLSPS